MKVNTLKIEKNIPIPVRTIYPFKDMQIGDSFFVSIGNDKPKYNQKQNVYMAMWKFCQKNTNKKFTTASIDNGIRVWRTQ